MTHYKASLTLRHQRGFSLIELMVVVAIIAILAAIAYPNYTNYLLKSRRSDARTLLTQIAAKEEQYFQDNRSYTTDLSLLGVLSTQAPAAAGSSTVISEHGFYNVQIAWGTTPNYTYTLTAIPNPGTPQAADSCTNFTINQDGTRTSTPATGCWQ